MGGKRYDEEPKLNKKKVFSVILGIIVIIMFILTLHKLLQDGITITSKSNEETEKYFAVYTDYKWGVVNQKGDYIINPSYDEMIVVPEETTPLFACIYDMDYQNETYKSKIINKENQAQFTDYDDAEFIVNYDKANVTWYEPNVIRVKKDDKYGLINFEGRELIKCEYDSIEALQGVKNIFTLNKDGKVGISDNFGNIIVEVKYKQVKPLVENDKKEFIIINDENKYGIALSNNTVSVECKYEDIKQVSASNIYVVKEDGKWQIINEDKSINIIDGFNDVEQIIGENIVIKKDNLYGLINSKEEELIHPEYALLAYAFGDNYIAKKDNKYGVVNTKGEVKLDFVYDNIEARADADLFIASQGEEEPQIIDREYSVKLTGIVSKVDVQRGYIKIYTNGEYKYYNFKCEEKQNTEIFPNNTLFLSKKDGKYGYINKQGDVVVDYIYNDAKEQNEYGYASVNKDGKWGCIDKEGNEVATPQYELKNNVLVEFIGKWHIAEDLNANYYTNAN
ncbi:MAG: WG repeat-containing protein [Clostridia bacterium]|nr:WG repeat-containing protein [Clostridia bacterium]